MRKIFNGMLQKIDSFYEDELATRNRPVSFKVATTALLTGSISCVLYVFYYLIRK